MKNALQTIYLRLDSTSQSLSKTALAQLILKVIFIFERPINIEEIESGISGVLNTKIEKERITEALSILSDEHKITPTEKGYLLVPAKRKNIEIALDEYDKRVKRIIEKFFSPAKSSKSAIRNWFENITIVFFSEYKTEWIAQKAYNVKQEDSYHGLQNIIETNTKNDNDIVEEDKIWLKGQYFKFINSSDDDVVTIFWDYGMCVYASTLITASTGADKISLETFKNSMFIIDTNILMYLKLEQDNYHDSYKSLKSIFEKLNIVPATLHITRDEYLRTMEYKREEVLRIIENFDKDVIEKLEDPFIKTAKGRECVTTDEYSAFFDSLLDMPDVFIDNLKIEKVDDQEVDKAVEIGMQNKELLKKLNEIYRNKHLYRKKGYIDSTKKGKDENKKPKDKKRRPLQHDAGLISGAELLRKRGKCFIITRDITVKQYGIQNTLRDEPPISIGLDNLISMLAIDNGGIDIDPSNFKPLFAYMIKLALIPEHGVIQIEDLSRILDIEHQIADLPSDEIIDIAKELNRNRFSDLDDEKINLQLTRRFQAGKLKLKQDLDSSRKETFIQKKEKERIIKKELKSREALRNKIYTDLMSEYENDMFKNKLIFFIGLPIFTILATLLGVYLFRKTMIPPLLGYMVGLFTNLIIWFLSNLLLVNPKLRKRYKNRVTKIDEEVNRRLNELLAIEE